MHVIGIKKLLHNEAKKLFFIKVKHCPTKIRHILSRWWACPFKFGVVLLQTAVHIGWPFEAAFLQLAGNLFNLSLAINDSLVLIDTSAGMEFNESHHHYFCVRNFFSFEFIAFFVLNKNESPALGTGIFPFVVCCLVSIY
jgi:hypothetical protein